MSDKKNKPNILLIFSDQHRADYAGFAGSKTIRTPNLDKLAGDGTVFDNAYCPYPLCSPSRQSFMAGLYPHDLEVWDNASAMREDTVTWAHILSKAGYETSLLGKMHFNGYQKMYGFDRRPVLEGNNNGESFYSWGLRIDHDWREPLPHSSNREENGMWKELEEAGADTPEREPIFRKDLEVLDGSLSFLDEKAAAEEDKPWAACAGFVLPHPPWKAREDILETYKGKGDLPFNHKGEKRDICDRYLQEFYGNLRHLSEEQIKKAREVYFALITEFDEYCGRILDKLESTGLAENTIVFYFSDHGELAGEHGNWSKVSLLEPSIRVPLIVSWKGHFESGRRCSVPVSLLDLHPTFTDIAGVELPENLVIRGKSLLPYIEGKADSPAGNDILVEMEGEGWNHCRACLRRGRYKLVYNHTDGYHFYDLEKDPHEMNDLSDNAEVADIAADMKKSLSGLWDDPEHLDRKVLNSQARRRIAKNRNPCKDLGY